MIDVICQQLGPKQIKTRRFSGGLWAVAMEEGEEKMQTRVENRILYFWSFPNSNTVGNNIACKYRLC